MIDSLNPPSQSALYLAASLGQDQILKQLIAQGATVSLRNQVACPSYTLPIRYRFLLSAKSYGSARCHR